MNENVKSAVRAKAKLSPNGRIVIPSALREQMGVKAGDTLMLDFEDGVLKIESLMTRVRRIQEEFRRYAKPGTLASDELISERREEARREIEEAEREARQDQKRKAG